MRFRNRARLFSIPWVRYATQGCHVERLRRRATHRKTNQDVRPINQTWTGPVTARHHREAVQQQSPESRSAPRGTNAYVPRTPKGCYNVSLIPRRNIRRFPDHTSCTTFGREAESASFRAGNQKKGCPRSCPGPTRANLVRTRGAFGIA